jgi:hypothetical protein
MDLCILVPVSTTPYIRAMSLIISNYTSSPSLFIHVVSDTIVWHLSSCLHRQGGTIPSLQWAYSVLGLVKCQTLTSGLEHAFSFKRTTNIQISFVWKKDLYVGQVICAKTKNMSIETEVSQVNPVWQCTEPPTCRAYLRSVEPTFFLCNNKMGHPSVRTSGRMSASGRPRTHVLLCLPTCFTPRACCVC